VTEVTLVTLGTGYSNGAMDLRRGVRFDLLRASLALAVLLAAAVLPAAAGAKRHRHRVHRADPVIAGGTSYFGVPWQATVPNGNPGVIQFAIDSREGFSKGWVDRLSVPSSAPSVFRAETRTDIDPRPEVELAGVTSPDVALLQVQMSDGEVLEVYPSPPSPAAQSRLPWLGQVRVFDAFFPAGGVVPEYVRAMDAGNNILADRPSNNGSF
jgi:hypothetical protein